MKYIVVVGGGMSNKGAQSMVFQIVDEMSKRYPNKKVVALTDIRYNDVKDMEPIYNFTIIPFGIRDIFYLYGGMQTIAAKMSGISKSNIKRLKEILTNTSLAFDVSGYSLSSNWNALNSIKYLYQIEILKKYNIPLVIMPQSFGPFRYNILFKQYIIWKGKKILPYPKLIFAREQLSYNEVKKQFSLNNVYLSKDMVLLGKEIDRTKVLKSNIKLREFNIENFSVAVVPNNKLVEKLSLENALKIYTNVINYLLTYNRTIYIIQHSEADIALCIKIKEKYSDNLRIKLIKKNLNCLEYDLLIQQFDYIIASRYHSLVHAYKKNIPCIAIGWAEKYNSLMEVMNQQKYMIDAKKSEIEDLSLKIDLMEENFKEEKRTIQNIFNKIDVDIYGKIFEKIRIEE